MDQLTVAKTACSHLELKMSERQLRDYQPFFDSLADDVELTEATTADSSEIHGKQTLVDAITGTFTGLSEQAQSEDIELERPLEFLSNGDDRVVVLWTECTRNNTTGTITSSTDVVVVMDLHDGLITRMRKFTQPARR